MHQHGLARSQGPNGTPPSPPIRPYLCFRRAHADGDRVLPPGGRGGFSRAMPSGLIRDLHYRVAVGWLSHWLWNGSFTKILMFYAYPCTAPIVAPVALLFAMVVDTVMATVCGGVALLECVYLLLRYSAATPAQVLLVAAKRHWRRSKAGDETALPIDRFGQIGLPVHLMTPKVNSHTLAASFLTSVLVIYVELKNLVVSIDDDDTRRLCCETNPSPAKYFDIDLSLMCALPPCSPRSRTTAIFRR